MSSEKSTTWWNQEVKEDIRGNKATPRGWLTNKSSEQLQLQCSAARKTAATIVKQIKETLWEEFGQRLDTDYRSASKVFWQTIRRLHCKRTPVATFIEDTNGFETSKGHPQLLKKIFL